METYEKLLDRAHEKIKVVQTGGERFEMPKVQGQVSGKNTIITNIAAIASYIRRPIEQVAKFLIKELATPGEVENDRLILKTRLSSQRVTEKLELYVKDFVICPECKKPDTEVVVEKDIKFKHCLACGAKTPIRSKI